MESLIKYFVILILVKTSVCFTPRAAKSDKSFDDISSRMKRLESRDQEQQQEIDDLRSELLVQKKRVVALERTIRTTRVCAVKEQSVPLQTTTNASDNKERTEYVEEVRGNNTDSAMPIQVQETRRSAPVRRNRIRNISHGSGTIVAFFATLSHHLRHVGINQKIEFDNVVTNIGKAYYPHFGAFIAPVSGVYVFTLSAHGIQDTPTTLSFVKNGVVMSNMYIHGPDGTSQTIVLELSKSDDVAVENNVMDGAVNGYMYSMISGFLISSSSPPVDLVGKCAY